MSAHDRQATRDYIKEMDPQSRSKKPSRAPIGPWALAASGIALAGVVLAVVASFATVIKITVLTVVPDGGTFTGLDRYGPALLILAGFALVMIFGAIRGSRPAMAAVALTGLGVLLVSILVDVPHIHDTGVWPKNDLYEDAQANPGEGFYMETAAGVLLLLGGALMLLLAGRPVEEAPTREERRAERDEELERRYDRERRRERTARVAQEPVAAAAAAEEPVAAAAEPADPSPPSFEIPELPSSLPPEPSSAARFSDPPAPAKRRSGGLVGRLGLRKR